MDALTNKQDETAANIQRLCVNFKKTPLDRRTVGYTQAKLKELDQLWVEFDQLDNTIRRLHGNETAHPYFANDFHQKMGAKYNEARELLQATLEAMSKPSPKITPTASTSEAAAAAALSSTATVASSASISATTVALQSANIKRLIEVMLISLKKYVLEHRSPRAHAIQLRGIEQHWQTVQELHRTIMNTVNVQDNTVYDLDWYLEKEQEVNEYMIQLQDKADQATAFASATVPERVQVSSSLTLPKISLPTFNGNQLQWRQFRDLFVELVHHQQIPPCQKMWYLKTALTDEAAGLIRHFSATAANYEAAWSVVNDRYENKRLLVNACIDKLLTQPSNIADNATAIKQLHDTTQECLLSLQNLSIDIDNWDPIIIHILVQKLHKTTHSLWEQSLTRPRELPSIKEFLKFLELRFQSLEAVGSKSQVIQPKRQGGVKALSAAVERHQSCIACHQQHKLFTCEKFLSLPPNKRLNLVQQAKGCVNCLNTGHKARECTAGTCNKCQGKHNTLLHLEKMIQPQRTAEPPVALTALPNQETRFRYTILSTVCVSVTDKWGTKINCRAILDSGSQANFITQTLAKRLGMSKISHNMEIEGIGETRKHTMSRVNIELSSKTTGFSERIEALVIPQIVSNQPAQHIDITAWKIPKNLQMADPNFNESKRIDLLIGAGIFYPSLCVGQIKLGDGLPLLQNTVFGWIVGGEMNGSSNSRSAICGINTEINNLNETMERFWQLEERSETTQPLTRTERNCEAYFCQSYRRHHNGRFIVRLPFEQSSSQLGESQNIALQRFKAIERKLLRNPDLKMQYSRFMEEYKLLGHMEEVNLESIGSPSYFLPHHAIIKPDSTTTKLRVVFDASAKTSTNISLNDLLSTGPKIQEDVLTILLRFRLPRYAFTADIEKMYRQILMHEDDKRYQLIWWREDPEQRIKCYQLTTVTYGTTSAPYLAVRCLQQLAKDNECSHPLASSAIRNNFYVDDVLTGADNIATALAIQEQLQEVLNSAGFKLRKWCANDPRLLRHIPAKDQEVCLNFHDPSIEQIKTMGLIWHPKQDVFSIKVEKSEKKRITKRTALSNIARLFDPVGFMAPVVVKAKLFLQQLWKLKLDWDAALPQNLHTEWEHFRNELELLQNISVPRHLFGNHTTREPQLHIFADASERAYGAVAYMRTTGPHSTVIVRFLCAKSRVAPSKQITLPRLELCAAQLATQLLTQIQRSFPIPIAKVHMWSDSTVVLGWINSKASNYHTFVANRISDIQQITSTEQWKHVRSEENPADLISRGLTPKGLINNQFWFYGPRFLHGSETMWPPQHSHLTCALELRQRAEVSVTAVQIKESLSLFNTIKYNNSLRRLQRIMAYVLRFISATQQSTVRAKETGKTKRSVHTRANVLLPTATEMDEALKTLVKISQEEHFAEEMKTLRHEKCIKNDSHISSLTPFIDNNGILRVGGRLQASLLSYDAKHPMLLPYHHSLTKLIFETLHKEHLHVGAQTLLAIVRQRFWPLKGKNIARATIQGCLTCTKAKPRLYEQLMGTLPKDRVQPSRPFINAGVDFFGPVWVHFKLRGKRPLKSYVAVFCCFATKAVHLELVSDLTTDAFLGALRRFMSRRGHCNKVYCDNATNFVGAKNQLCELNIALFQDNAQQKIQNECSKKNIQFSFIPPRAPHFGGLWEAAVKSAKHLLQSTIAAANLTHEEMETLIVEAEAIMNSRPLTPMSSDPNDLTALTPGHFLIGEPLTATPDPHALDNNLKPLARWKLVTHLKSEFWKRWTSEYLHSLQHRYKWKKEMHDIQPDTMVLIKEDNLPSFKWSIGRIQNVIKGDDGLVRVADVKTTKGIIRRPITKLAPLPTEGDKVEKSNTSMITPLTSEDTSADIAPPKKKTRITNLSAVVTVLIACCTLPFCSSAVVDNQQFTKDSGLYFERLGTVNIISSEWNLITYVNMQSYWKNFDVVNKYPTTLRQLCNSTKEDTCSSTILLIERLIGELQSNNVLLSPHSPGRTKRGAFNIIGNVANALFGVLDSDYAENAADTIKKIQANEYHLADQLRNQTLFLDNTLNIMKRNQRDVEAEFRIIQNSLNTMNNIIDHQQTKDYFTSAVIQITLMLSYLERVQDSLIDLLADSHHGKISNELLSPQQLQNELYKLKTHLPNSLKLPLTSEELLKFYNLMTIEAQVTQEFIIFKVSIPLATAEDYELLKLTSIPWKTKGDNFAQISLSFPYMIVNLHRDQYYPLPESELRSCRIVKGESYLCYQNHPLYKRGSHIGSCELNLLTHETLHIPCPISLIGKGPHWIRLHNPNKWIYAVEKGVSINAVCGNKLQQLHIEGTGILTLQEECTIKQPLITIQGHRYFESGPNTAYIPSINISSLNISSDKLSLQIQTHYISHENELEALQSDLKRLTVNEPISYHDIHQYTLGYICLTMTAIIMCVLLIQRYKQRQRITLSDNQSSGGTEMITIHGPVTCHAV